MAKKQDFKNMSTKKKSRKLFLGMLMPLLTVTVVACTFFYYMSNVIVEYYINAELKGSVERMNSSVLEKMDPVIVNVENFANFATLTDDSEVLYALVKTFSKNLQYASSFYYGNTVKRSQGGLFLESNDWQPPESFEHTERQWFVSAQKNPHQMNFSTPYLDAETNKLAVTVSKAVLDEQGRLKGVVSCDIQLDELIAILADVKISQNAKMNLINQDGFYMTHSDSSKIMTRTYFADTSFSGDIKEWMNGELKSVVDKKNYYAVCKIGPSPWYIVVEGPLVDFKGKLGNTILIFEILLAIFSFVSSVANINTIRKMRLGEQELGKQLFEETQTLVVAAKENAATSQDQSAAVKEIVATMEDSNALSESISSKIRDVSKVAEKTSADVADGVSSIEQNVAQLHAIFDANQQTIDGMKVLSERIESIWDIVTLINNVADQAKIIAFNAELEASSAGEAGKSFRIVANEIRRLSDGIIDGTKEIKERITEIQHSSDSLILASESGTEKINEGYENAKSLGEKFASIKNSAEVTASSAGDITDIIQQQTTASEQILIALKQISAGVENFTVATDNISASSEHIRAMSEQMNNSVKSVEKNKK
ncbi:MAG: hypothetical protein IJ688_09830 [Treponema sp.]|nr:hypothetical protein [Treponema sp.]